MKTIAIIPSAGIGKRFESKIPKQFLKINGIEILVHTLIKFQKAKLIDEVIVSSHPDYIDKTRKLIAKNSLTKVTKVVEGGKERQDSVYNALKLIESNDDDLICVHDAVRPLITSVEIDELINYTKKKKAVIAAQKAIDTIKVGDNFVKSTLDRSKIWIVQTPQVFTYKILKRAFQKAYEDKFYGTDESSLVERIGVKVYFYQLQSENRKITLLKDIKLAQSLL